MAKPNLERIPGDGDDNARRVLKEAPAVIDAAFVSNLDSPTGLALGRYGARAATIALRNQSREILRFGLLATALSELVRPGDDRDFMVGLALHFGCARRLGTEPSVLFDEIADRITDTHLADLLRRFGARDDVTLGAFGWRLIDTPDGPDFEPI